jgi:hypothetical protein
VPNNYSLTRSVVKLNIALNGDRLVFFLKRLKFSGVKPLTEIVGTVKYELILGGVIPPPPGTV